MQTTQPVQRNPRSTPLRSAEEMNAVRHRRGKLNKVQRQAKRDLWEDAE